MLRVGIFWRLPPSPSGVFDELNRPVSIYVYANAADMQGAMIFAQEWTGGATYPPYSTIVIGISSSNLTWGEGALVHELTHMVNYQMTNNPYSGLPTWFVGGLHPDQARR